MNMLNFCQGLHEDVNTLIFYAMKSHVKNLIMNAVIKCSACVFLCAYCADAKLMIGMLDETLSHQIVVTCTY